MKKLLLLLCVLLMAFAGCASLQQHQEAANSIAEKAGMLCEKFMPEGYKVALNTACIVHLGLNSETDPKLAQEALNDSIGQIWTVAYDKGSWVAISALNDLVRFMMLKTSEPTQEMVGFWISCMNEFCKGAQIVKDSEAKKEAAVYRFLPGYASRDTRENIAICALTDNGRPNLAGCY